MSWDNLLDTITNHVLGVIQANDESMNFLTGEVIEINPLRIKINERFTLDESSLLLSALVKETYIQIPEPTDLNMEDAADNIFQHRHEIDAETEEASDGHGMHKHAIKIYTKFALPRIRLWRGLLVGDVVRLLKIQGGQLYFVLEREETITNEKAQEENNA